LSPLLTPPNFPRGALNVVLLLLSYNFYLLSFVFLYKNPPLTTVRGFCLDSPFEGIAVKLRSLKKVFERGTLKASGF